MSALEREVLDQISPSPVVVPFVKKKRKEPFTEANDGLPVYSYESDEKASEDWDGVNESIQVRLWSQASIAAAIVVVRGEKSLDSFAESKKLTGRWVRGMAKTYRTFENGKRFPNCSFYVHYVAAKAINPVRAVQLAHDEGMSGRQLDRWIKLGEGATDLAIAAGQADEFEDRDVQDDPVIVGDIELALRMLAEIKPNLKSDYVGRYIDDAIEQLDWELVEFTKAPAKVSQRVLSLVNAGCSRRDEIAKRAKLSVPETTKYLDHWVAEEKLEERKEGRRQPGQKGDTVPIWVPAGTPLADARLACIENRYEPIIER